MKTGIELITAERERQISVEGWTKEHDEQHRNNELGKAAICYIAVACVSDAFVFIWKALWPWDEKWWKPKSRNCDFTQSLVKAGALISAEIDRRNAIHGEEFPQS